MDTTVWIDFLRDRSTPQKTRLETLIHERADLCLCGFVLTEVLQGIRNEKQYLATKGQMAQLIYLTEDRTTFELGATIYRDLRKQGVTIRNSIDCLIAATVIQHGVALLDSDRDYFHIDQHFPLSRLEE